MRKRVDAVDPTSLNALVRHDWPGNVRELRNALERAMILARGPILSVEPPTKKSQLPGRHSARVAAAPGR